MTSRDFAFWLQGFLEIASAGDKDGFLELNSNQADKIKAHLSMVFKHEIDPSAGPPKVQAELNEIHSGPYNHLYGLKPDGTPYGPDEQKPRC